MGTIDHTLDVLERAREKSDHCAVGFSGGKDSAVTLDLCTRIFSKVSCFTFVFARGLGVMREVIDYPSKRYGIEKSIEMLDPRAGMARKSGWYCDTNELTDEIPDMSIVDGYRAAMGLLGAGVVVCGAKESDGVWRRQMLKKKAHNPDWLIYPILKWTKYDIAGYSATRSLSAVVGGVNGRCFGVDLLAKDLLWLHDNHPDDFDILEKSFPYIRTVVKRREFFGEQRQTD